METKFCKHCQCEHPLTDVWWATRKGKLSDCKKCQKDYCKSKASDLKDYRKAYNQINADKIKEQQKRYNQSHACQLKEKQAEYAKANAGAIKLKKKAYNKDNANIIKAKQKTYREQNIDSIKELQKKYCNDNSDALRSYRKQYYKNNSESINSKITQKKRTNVSFKLACALRTRLGKFIKRGPKRGSAVSDLGCTITELKQYLESKFQEGMTWDNHGFYGWHIDHIIPLASFDLTDREQFLKACHYTNLQPLWAKDNLKKGDKIC